MTFADIKSSRNRPPFSRRHTAPAPAPSPYLLDLPSLEALPSAPSKPIRRSPSSPRLLPPPTGVTMPLKKLRPPKPLTSFLPFGLNPTVAEVYGITTDASSSSRRAPPPLDPLIIPPPAPGKDDSFSPFGGSMRGIPKLATVPESSQDSPLRTTPLPDAPALEKGRKRADTVKARGKDKRDTMMLPMMAPPPTSVSARARGGEVLEEWEYKSFETMRPPPPGKGGGRGRAQTVAPPTVSLRASSASLASTPSTGSSRPSKAAHGSRQPSPVRPPRRDPDPDDAVKALEEMSGDMLRQAYPAQMQRFDLGGGGGGGRQRRSSDVKRGNGSSFPPPAPSESDAQSTATSHSHSQSATATASASGHSMLSWRESRKARKQVSRTAPPPPPEAPLPPLPTPVRSTSLAHFHHDRQKGVGAEEMGEVVVIDSAPEGPLLPAKDHLPDWSEPSIPRTNTGPPPIPPRSDLRGYAQRLNTRTASSVRSDESGRGVRVPLVLSPPLMSRGASEDSMISEVATPSNMPIHLGPLPPSPRAPARGAAEPLANAVPPPAVPKGLTRLRFKRPSTNPHPPDGHEDSTHPRKGLTRLLPLTSTKSKSVPPPAEVPHSTPEEYTYSSAEDRPPTHLSARDEPPADPRLMRMRSNESFVAPHCRGEGMTALTFLASEGHPGDTLSEFGAGGSQSPIVGHIMPPKELSKIGPSHLRTASSESTVAPPISSSPKYTLQEGKPSPLWANAATRARLLPYTGTALSPPPRPRGSIPSGTLPPRTSTATPTPMGISMSLSHSSAITISPTTPISAWRLPADARSAPPTRTSFFDHSDYSESVPSPDILAHYTSPSPRSSFDSRRLQVGEVGMQVTSATPSPHTPDFDLGLTNNPKGGSPTGGKEGEGSSDEAPSPAQETPRGPRSRSRTEHYVYPPTYNRLSEYPYTRATHALAEGMKSAESLLLDPSATVIRPAAARRSIGAGPFARYATASASAAATPMPRKMSSSTAVSTSALVSARGGGGAVGEDDVSTCSTEGGYVERAKERKAMNDWLAKPVSRRGGGGAFGKSSTIDGDTPLARSGMENEGWSVGGGVYGLRPMRNGSVSAVDLLSPSS